MSLAKNIAIFVVVGLVLCVIYGAVTYIRDLQNRIVLLCNELDKVPRRTWLGEPTSDGESSYEESSDEEDEEDEKASGRITALSVASDDGSIGSDGDDMIIDQE